MEIITFVIGLVIGLAIACFFLNKRLSDAVNSARSEGQVELALLNERLAGAAEDVKRLRSELEEAGQLGETIRQQLEASRHESAQLTERASRVPVLETALKPAATSAEEQSQQVSALASKAGGRRIDPHEPTAGDRPSYR